MTPLTPRKIWRSFQERLRLVWPLAAALGMIAFSAQRVAPVVRENGVRTSMLDRLNRELESLQRSWLNALDDSIASRAEEARANLITGELGVRTWLQAVVGEANRVGLHCAPQIGLGLRPWEDSKVEVVEVILELKATAEYPADTASSARITDLLHALVTRPEWVEFSELSLTGAGTGVASASLKVRLWVAVLES